MITDWTTGDGLRAIEIADIQQIRQCPGRNMFLLWIGGGSELVLPESVALAILRDHARKWLATKGIQAEINEYGQFVVTRWIQMSDGFGFRFLLGGEWVSENEPLHLREDYDQALISAVLAAGKDGEK